MSGTSTEAAAAELHNLARRFPLESKAGEITHEKAINLVSFRHGYHQYRPGIGSGTDAAGQYEKSGAPSGLQSTTPDKPPFVTLPEAKAPAPDGSVTADRTASFEDRWSAQSGVSYLAPSRPELETTGRAAKF